MYETLKFSGWQTGRLQSFWLYHHAGCFKVICVLQKPAAYISWDEMSSSAIYQVTGSLTLPIPVIHHSGLVSGRSSVWISVGYQLSWLSFSLPFASVYLSKYKYNTRVTSLTPSDLFAIHWSSYRQMLHSKLGEGGGELGPYIIWYPNSNLNMK